ncbi:18721_t:CDS:2, partial [Racocetra fulgida]
GKLDVINLQGLSLSKQDRDYAAESLWDYASHWSSTTAILTGNDDVKFEDFEEIEYGITTSVIYWDRYYQITNIYVPLDTDELTFLEWIPYGIYIKDNTVNVIVGELNINLSTLYSERFSGFTDIMDILGESFIQDILDIQGVPRNYKELLEDSETQRMIADKIDSVNTVLEWDILKKHFQYIFQNQRQRKFSIFNLNSLDNKKDLSYLDQELREDLIKAGWADSDKRATSTIRNPSTPTSEDPKEILTYLRNFYQELFKNDVIDSDIANEITDGLQNVTVEQNNSLTKDFTDEEIIKIISKLDNQKGPGIDGLPFEFYKQFQEKLVPILNIIFNFILKTDSWPWDLNLIKIANLDANEYSTAAAINYLWADNDAWSILEDNR